jgi:branched-chain amino acid transport system substrate-binding protein
LESLREVRAVIRSQFLSALGATPVALSLPSVVSTTTIGVVAPLSGPARAMGLQIEAGARGCIDELNNYGLSSIALGQAYSIRSFDDQNSIASAILQAQFATGDSSIVAVIGHLNADATLQAIPTYGAAQMPLIVPASTDDRITATNYRNVFRLPTKDSFEGGIFARAVVKQYAPKTPYVFVQNADYGADVANGFIDAMSGAKIETKYQQFTYDKPDFGAIVDKALAVAPDYVFLAGTATDMGGIVPVLRAKGYAGPIGASQGFFDPGTLKLGPPANDLLISASMPYLTFAPSSVRLVNDYQMHSGAMTPLAAFGYASMQLIAAVLQRSGANARNTLLDAMHTGIPTGTIVGNYTFTASGDPLDPELYFYTVRDGKFAYLHQAHPSTFMIK